MYILKKRPIYGFYNTSNMYKKGVSFCSDKKGDKSYLLNKYWKIIREQKRNIDFIVFCRGFICQRKYFYFFFYYFKSNYHAQKIERFNLIRPVPIKITLIFSTVFFILFLFLILILFHLIRIIFKYDIWIELFLLTQNAF